MIKSFLKRILAKLYRVDLQGLENLQERDDRVLIVANHTSFLDPVLLALFLPGNLTFAVNSHVASRGFLKYIFKFVKIFPMDPTNPMSLNVFAGAEKLQEETRRSWSEKLGVRIFEGYGTTETSPVLSTNTPMDNRPGSVGRLMPGIEYELEPVPGINVGGRLYVKGPNVMLGYYLHDKPGVLVPPVSSYGEGWYDTGDIVTIDDNNFIQICGRAKRFAKIGGEMVSLSAVEELAVTAWPESEHAVIAVPDTQKGEQLILLTTYPQATRKGILEQAKQQGTGEVNVPKKMVITEKIPLLGTGKTDYKGVAQLITDAAKAEV